MTTALVITGHGSHISPLTAGLVWNHVDALRSMGVADEITAAFWKEMPAFHTVFRTLTADDITVVPLFTAQGYFTQTVIPVEMGLTGAITERDGRMIRYTRTLNEHPYLSQIVQQRVTDALAQFKLAPDQTAVAIIGHSTRRNPESRKATETQADQIRQLNLAAETWAVYLDDSPEIPEVYELAHSPNLIAVPYFLALGSHTTIDVPAALGLPPSNSPRKQGENLLPPSLAEEGWGRGKIRGKNVYYTSPVGIDENLREVILELARDAGTPLYEPKSGSAWECFPMAGRDFQFPEFFGQLHITPTEICVAGDKNPAEIITDPGVLRARIRENPFRPLSTSADLPGGWRVPISSPEMAFAVIETIYPGALADFAAEPFAANSLEKVAARQTGMYRNLDQLTTDERLALVNQICGNCVRHPTWFDGEHGDIPCPEPCNFWMSAALEAKI